MGWSNRTMALLIARLLLGLLFFMGGVHKIVLIGLTAGAESMFVEPMPTHFSRSGLCGRLA